MTQSLAQSLTDLRLLMRQNIYSNSEYSDLLLENIEQIFDCTNITFNAETMDISIKIKKTAMKKAEDYSHSVMYYYPLINKAFVSFLNDARIQDELKDCDIKECNIIGFTYEKILSNILSIIDARTLMDNIIIIKL